MPKTAADFIELMKNPQSMTKEDAKELSDYLKLISRKGYKVTEEEKELSDLVWQNLKEYSRDQDKKAAARIKKREEAANAFYLNAKGKIKDDEDKKNATLSPAELAQEPYDKQTEAVWEQGRHRGKGRMAYLLETYRPLADKDSELKELLDRLESYVKVEANATDMVGDYQREIRRFQSLCRRSERFLASQEQRQLDPVLGDSEEGMALFAAANDINQFILSRRDGELDRSRPYAVPRNKKDLPAWEEPEPEIVDATGAFIKLRAKVGNNGTVLPDKELDKRNEPLFPHDPSPMDIAQGRLGDCYLMASLSSLAAQNPEKIKQMMVDNGDGTVTVRFFKKEINNATGALLCYRPILVTVDKTVPERGGSHYCLWASMIERAYAAADLHTGHTVTQGVQGMDATARYVYQRLSLHSSERMSDADMLEKEIRDLNARELYPFLFDADGKLRTDFSADYANVMSGTASIFLEQLLGPEAEGETVLLEDIAWNGTVPQKDQQGKKKLPTPNQQAINKIEGILRKALDQGSLVNAGTHGDNDETIENGIFNSHAYTVLSMGQKTVDGITDTFITVRNPHGHTGRRYVAEKGQLVPQKWEADGGVFDVRLSDFCREFSTVSINHTESVALPEQSADPLKHKYLSMADEIRYRTAFEILENMFDKAVPFFLTDKAFDELHKKVGTCVRHLCEEQGQLLSKAADSSVLLSLRRSCEKYLQDHHAVITDKQKEAIQTTLDLLAGMRQGYGDPRDAFREKIVTKILSAQCERKRQSADANEKREGDELHAILNDPARQDERAKLIDKMVHKDVTISYLMAKNQFVTVRALGNEQPDRLLALYELTQPEAQAVEARTASANVSARKAPGSMTLYYAAMQEIGNELLATDKNLPEYKNSPQYRDLRNAIKEYLESLTEPQMEKKSRRDCAHTEKAEALKRACENYQRHCDDTPQEKNKSRRIKRVQQMNNVLHLLNGMEKNVYDDPRDYMRMQLAERAAAGLQMLYSVSENEQDRREGERLKAVLANQESRERDMLIVRRYGEPGFKDFTKKVSFQKLTQMMNLSEPDLMRQCFALKDAWDKKHPTREQRIARSKDRALYELSVNGKKPVYSVQQKPADPAQNRPVQNGPLQNGPVK